MTEELMPLPQEVITVDDDDAADPLDLAGSVAPGFSVAMR
jgi:hypothetical protein